MKIVQRSMTYTRAKRSKPQLTTNTNSILCFFVALFLSLSSLLSFLKTNSYHVIDNMTLFCYEQQHNSVHSLSQWQLRAESWLWILYNRTFSIRNPFNGLAVKRLSVEIYLENLKFEWANVWRGSKLLYYFVQFNGIQIQNWMLCNQVVKIVYMNTGDIHSEKSEH